MKAIKRPVEIEFIPVRDLVTIYECNNCIVLPSWVNKAISSKVITFVPLGIEVVTLEGNHAGLLNDILLQGIKGELYPCKPDIFYLTYDVTDTRTICE